MSLTLDLDPAVETSLRGYAAAEGVTPDTFVARLLAKYEIQHDTQSEAEPVWKTRLRASQKRMEQARLESGLTDADIEADIDAEIKANRTFPPYPQAVDQAIPTARKAPRLQVLSREQAALLNAPSIQRLEAELAEAANTTPEEAAQADAEWQSLKQALNYNRRATGERLLFPDPVQP